MNPCAHLQQISKSTWTSLGSLAGRGARSEAALSGSCVENPWGRGKHARARSGAPGMEAERGGPARPQRAHSRLGQTWPGPAWAACVAADSAVWGSPSQDTPLEGGTERLAPEDSAAARVLLQQRAGSGGAVGTMGRPGESATRAPGRTEPQTLSVSAQRSSGTERTRAVRHLGRIALPLSS